MAWKRLTTVQDLKTDVNMDNVCYILPSESYLTLYFVGGKGEAFLSLTVKEKPDQIHKEHSIDAVE